MPRPSFIQALAICQGPASSSTGPEAEVVEPVDEEWGCWEEGMESEAEEADPVVEVEPKLQAAPAEPLVEEPKGEKSREHQADEARVAVATEHLA